MSRITFNGQQKTYQMFVINTILPHSPNQVKGDKIMLSSLTWFYSSKLSTTFTHYLHNFIFYYLNINFQYHTSQLIYNIRSVVHIVFSKDKVDYISGHSVVSVPRLSNNHLCIKSEFNKRHLEIYLSGPSQK